MMLKITRYQKGIVRAGPAQVSNRQVLGAEQSVVPHSLRNGGSELHAGALELYLRLLVLPAQLISTRSNSRLKYTLLQKLGTLWITRFMEVVRALDQPFSARLWTQLALAAGLQDLAVRNACLWSSICALTVAPALASWQRWCDNEESVLGALVERVAINLRA